MRIRNHRRNRSLASVISTSSSIAVVTALAVVSVSAPAFAQGRPQNPQVPQGPQGPQAPVTTGQVPPTQDPAQPPAPTLDGPVEQPRKVTAGTVTLDEAVKRALTRNPTVQIATEEIARAEAISKQVRATWWPTLYANGTYTRLDKDRVSNGIVISDKSQLNGNIQLSIPLVEAKQWVAHARSKDAIELARISTNDARRQIGVAAARAYLTVIAEKRVLYAAQRALITAKAHEDFSQTRFKGGVGNRLDAVRASTERATAEVQVKRDLAALEQSQEALGVLLGDEGSVDAAEDPSFAAPPNVDAAIGEATTRRADIAVEREKVDIARKSVRDSWVDYLPTLSALGQPFYQDPPTLTTPKTGWQAQLLLQIPLFDGGLRYGLADERQALENEARTRLEGALRQAKSEVRTAFDSMRRADEALVGARESVKFAREALELSQLAYRAGATSNIEVIDAERRAQDADTALAVAEDSSRQARVDLLSACGRFP